MSRSIAPWGFPPASSSSIDVPFENPGPRRLRFHFPTRRSDRSPSATSFLLAVAFSFLGPAGDMVVTDDGEGEERSTPVMPAPPALRKKERGRRSHSEAERKRRQRINAHLATLRTLVPSASRMDKAALLGEVVRHVRELRAKASDAAEGVGAGVIPGESDEVGAEEEEDDDYWRRRHGLRHFGADDDDSLPLPPRRVVRAWVCCDDRPGLLSDLGRAVGSVRNARPVRVEIATVGGRTRSVLQLDVCDGDGDDHATAAAGNRRAVALSTLRAAMRAVLLNRRGGVQAATLLLRADRQGAVNQRRAELLSDGMAR